MNFFYQLSESWAAAEWLRTGIRPSKMDTQRRIEIPDTALSAETRATILRLSNGKLKDEFSFAAPGIFGSNSKTFDRILTEADIALELINMDNEFAAHAEKKAAEDADRKEKDRLVKADTEQRAVTYKAKQEADAKATAEARAYMIDWIAQYGSARLKKCAEHGYNCVRLYWIERAESQFPGWMLDYNDTASWDSRSGPSLAALEELELLKKLYPDADIAIVWLKEPPSNEPDGEADAYDFEPHEAIAMKPASYTDWLVK